MDTCLRGTHLWGVEEGGGGVKELVLPNMGMGEVE